MAIARLAELGAATPDVERQRLLLAEFLEEFQQEPVAARGELLLDEPQPTGSLGWDALLAGLAEHLAREDRVEPAARVEVLSRFLDEPWCYFDLPFFRAEAERETPSSFRRRGVLIRAVELERV